MACRTIIPCANQEYIIKKIEYSNDLKSLLFPKITDDIWEIIDTIQQLLVQNDINKITQQAIIQQYNEIILYQIASVEQKNILAPQLQISYDMKNNLPEIIYPSFTPIMYDKEVWHYTEEELYILFGLRAKNLSCSEENVLTFVQQVHKFCEAFSLSESDIFNNPSNIGYHPSFGLRIIDYGLTNTESLIEI